MSSLKQVKAVLVETMSLKDMLAILQKMKGDVFSKDTKWYWLWGKEKEIPTLTIRFADHNKEKEVIQSLGDYKVEVLDDFYPDMDEYVGLCRLSWEVQEALYLGSSLVLSIVEESGNDFYQEFPKVFDRLVHLTCHMALIDNKEESQMLSEMALFRSMVHGAEVPHEIFGRENGKD